MLHLKLIISLSFSFLLFIDCFISAKMRILSFILSRKGRFSALERAFSGTLKGVVPKKFSGGQPPNPKFLFASLACPPHILAAGAAPEGTELSQGGAERQIAPRTLGASSPFRPQSLRAKHE